MKFKITKKNIKNLLLLIGTLGIICSMTIYIHPILFVISIFIWVVGLYISVDD